MPDAIPWHEKYGARFAVNAALLTVVTALAWLWFAAHVRPHISGVIFSGVSVATFGGVAIAVFASFFDKHEAMSALNDKLKSKGMTPVVMGALPVIAFAYATTFTVYVTQADGAGEVRLNVTKGTTPKPVALTTTEKVKAVSYFFAFRPVTVSIETLAPIGFKSRTLPLRRGMPLQITVPNAADAKSYHILRLVPCLNLFHLRGQREADRRYVVRVFLPGHPPIVRSGLTFSAIYLGAQQLEELKAQAKSASTTVDDLRDRLISLDETMSKQEIKGILAAWLDNPEFIPSAELAAGDKVRVVLESPAGRTDTTVTIASAVNSVFLDGAGE